MAGDEKKKGSSTAILIVVGAVVCCCVCGGIGAAIGLPAFTRYTSQSKVSEARMNLRAIFTGAAAYYQEEHFPPGSAFGGPPVTQQLPPAAPRTPDPVPCGVKQLWPPMGHPSWQALGFAPADPLYYSYEWIPGPGGTFTIRAYGDLDCDGTLSTFELSGRPDAYGMLQSDPIVEVDPLE